jgi:hypothetical protein
MCLHRSARTVILSLAVMAVVPLCSKTSIIGNPGILNFCPIEKGNVWVYKSNGVTSAPGIYQTSLLSTVTITSTWLAGGTNFFAVSIKDSGIKTSTDPVTHEIYSSVPVLDLRQDTCYDLDGEIHESTASGYFSVAEFDTSHNSVSCFLSSDGVCLRKSSYIHYLNGFDSDSVIILENVGVQKRIRGGYANGISYSDTIQLISFNGRVIPEPVALTVKLGALEEPPLQ